MNAVPQFQYRSRRGNALILVAGVLVLLVIMATVFLSRAGTLRALGTAQRQSAFHSDRQESVASEIAQEVADSLFVRPIDFTSFEFGGLVPPDEHRRKRSAPGSSRYGVDPDFTWNRAPWEVVPWTNPPDWLTYPLRPGKLREMAASSEDLRDVLWTNWQWWDDSQYGVVDLFQWPDAWESWPPEPVLPSEADPLFDDVVLQPRENPLGGPGVSDTRWLRDIEPQRMPVRAIHNPDDATPNGTDSPTNPWSDRLADAYSHWRHLSWIGRSGNAWRMCPDIADVTGERSTMTAEGVRHADGTWQDGRTYYGGAFDRMDVPIEQWPAMMPTAPWDGSHQQDRFWPDGVMARLTDPEEFSFGDTATSVFVPDDPGVVMPANPVDMTAVQNDDHLLDFWDRWLAWLRPEGYKQALVAARGGNGNLIPPNFYDLDDLDGDGKRGEYFDPKTWPGDDLYDPDEDSRWGETPMDEFRPGTARWHVSRILTDTDGDGFTDSFWWLSPHVGVDGTRQVIGVSVTDNSGRLNANVATRFLKNEYINHNGHDSTRGWTPSDLALVGQNFTPGANGDGELLPDEAVWNTGFFDIEAHQPPFAGEWTFPQTQDWHPELTVPFVTYPGNGVGSGREWSKTMQQWKADYWQSNSNRAFLEGLNIDLGGSVWNPFFPNQTFKDIKSRSNRLHYFQQSGQEPQHPGNVFTPFNLADELELRANEGNNHGGIYSRFERMLGPSMYESSHILRGTFADRGSGEAAEQLDNRQLAHDLRHRMTLFNGARNETLPPHLWWEYRAPPPRADDIVVGGELKPLDPDGLYSTYDKYVEDMHERFHSQMRQKLDLREWERAARSQPAFNTEYDPRAFSDRLSQSILLGLTSGDVT
ncbi:MAG TPA: hypothetical protein QF800_06590, partial [Phycisphaerales bacterium]|nr:hypothetical protein [Phycisphaerales bacterium]